MQYEKYGSLSISGGSLEFEFVSEGPKGNIPKIVQFMETNDPLVYNLAFGNLLPDGSVDDHIKNNNKDRNKILATVAAIIYEFTARCPGKLVFFTGSTPERTRLYRMALTINLEELKKDFEVYGIDATKGALTEPFMKGKEYSGFLIKRKFN
ncbi:DUF6934 family protein [Chitinophaga tropicalis]|uniref:Uncharacterized protein n=1 Tax=Chitinophaga tropicalis TaxID=2683588 RepID=A0A7K1U6E5_9BACT|nr:hypothetical protein [Chitinophaga tropicalis]MVT09927.1 hypothetical protein [Chitinophaga tropicalis]